MGAAHAVTRRFVWTENVLLKEDLVERRVGMVISGKDIIMDAERLRKYLFKDRREIVRSSINNIKGAEQITTDGLDLLSFKHLNHAEVFENKEERKMLAAMVWRYSCEG